MCISKVVVVLFSACSLALVTTGSAEVYKWVDEGGNVHYGDCPPSDCKYEEIHVAPTPSDETVKATQERMRQIEEYNKKLRESRQDQASEKRTEHVRRLENRFPTDTSCFTPLWMGWDDRITDTLEGFSRTPLTKIELQQLRSLFNALEGRRSGTMEETVCIMPDATPPMESYRYKLRLDAHWHSKDVFRLEANFKGIDDRNTLRKFYWFLLDRQGLRFRASKTDVSFELDEPANDVGILSVEKGLLTFFLHHRVLGEHQATVRRAAVFSLQRSRRGFNINELSYVQGSLAKKREWMIGR